MVSETSSNTMYEMVITEAFYEELFEKCIAVEPPTTNAEQKVQAWHEELRQGWKTKTVVRSKLRAICSESFDTIRRTVRKKVMLLEKNQLDRDDEVNSMAGGKRRRRDDEDACSRFAYLLPRANDPEPRLYSREGTHVDFKDRICQIAEEAKCRNADEPPALKPRGKRPLVYADNKVIQFFVRSQQRTKRQMVELAEKCGYVYCEVEQSMFWY
ncbi:hypothetical protein QR680_011081 [Steinernema hermaphroditum]|uniref:Uncharacterized protein n=1 Tax=Steinernema hermaphroditum TaxID=289476 RepID=A0AA39MC83_9BILA|nr:hypothetical protein QR680_011081 [Steinernema hermaphroditum]